MVARLSTTPVGGRPCRAWNRFTAGTSRKISSSTAARTAEDQILDTPPKEPLSVSEQKLYKSPGHHTDFVECVRARRRPICDVEIGARSVTVCHLVNLAYWHNQKLKWDPMRWEFVGANAAEANKWRGREQRDGYKLPSIA